MLRGWRPRKTYKPGLRAPVADGGTKGHYRWVVLAVSTGAQAVFFGAVFQGLPAFGPVMRSTYDLNLGQLGLVLSSVTLGILVGLLGWGAAADRFGERRVMVLGLLGAAIALLAASRAQGIQGLVAALFVAGVCGASVNVSSGRAVVGWFAFRERGLAMGIRMTALPLGAAAAAVSLPVLVTVSGVGGALTALAACCAMAAGAVAVWVREPPGRAGRPSENTGKSPYRDPRIWRIAIAGTLLAIPQFGVVALFVVFLHDELGYPVAAAARILAAVQLLGGASRILVGRWADVRRRRLMPLQKLGLATSVALTTPGILLGSSTPILLPVLLAASVLAISWNGLAQTTVAELADRERTGTALGFYNTVMGVGAAAAPPALAGFVGATSSWLLGFVAVAACSLSAVLILAPLVRHERIAAAIRSPGKYA